MSYETLLNNVLYKTTKASSQNQLGEWTYTYTDSTTKTKCRMVPITISERIERPGIFDDVKYTCYCVSSAGLTTNSTITYQGVNYRVKACEFDSSFHHQKALLSLIS